MMGRAIRPSKGKGVKKLKAPKLITHPPLLESERQVQPHFVPLLHGSWRLLHNNGKIRTHIDAAILHELDDQCDVAGAPNLTFVRQIAVDFCVLGTLGRIAGVARQHFQPRSFHFVACL